MTVSAIWVCSIECYRCATEYFYKHKARGKIKKYNPV